MVYNLKNDSNFCWVKIYLVQKYACLAFCFELVSKLIQTIWKTYISGFLCHWKDRQLPATHVPPTALCLSTLLMHPNAFHHLPSRLRPPTPGKRGGWNCNGRRKILGNLPSPTIFFSCRGPSVPLHLLNPLNVPPPRLERKVFCINRSRNCKWTLPSDTFIPLVE